MMFRRIKAHIEKENWFAVGIDFFIVVIGVFIGIQVANWNDARANAAKEKIILAAILEDVEDDLQNINSAFESAALATQATNELLIIAGLQPLTELKPPIPNAVLTETDTLISELPETRTEEIWTAIIVRYYPSQADAAFAGLMSAGDLSIISDLELANSLQRYRAVWDATEISQISTFRQMRDRLVFVGQEFGLSPYKEIGKDELAALIAQNPEFEGAVRTMQEYGILHWQVLTTLRDDAEALASDLREELGIDK
ncbi:MAG: hypothetical protein AAF498_13980 [Pseudomonadota bacterium]